MKTTERGEDYLKYIYIISKTQEVRAVRLAEVMGLTKPTVSVALRALVQDGYITLNEDREILLTDAGRAIAEKTFEKHQAFENLLLGIGVSDETAHEDACRLEHAISHESFDALKKTVLEAYGSASGTGKENQK